MELHKRTLPNGFVVDAQDNAEFIIQEIWVDELYNQEYQIRSGDTVVDLGANQGFFSLYAASHGAQVMCYEPEPATFGVLTTNINRNDLASKITPVNAAVGDRNGEITIRIPHSDAYCTSGMVSTSTRFIDNLSTHADAHIEEMTVPLVRFGDVLASLKRVDLLKIDCEGAELDIMKGATETEMGIVQNIVMETHEAYEEKELFWSIRRHGFAVSEYRKLTGHYPSGYLYATRISDTQTRQSPVVILTGPTHARVGENIAFDASKSFSCLNEYTNPVITWMINSRSVKNARPSDFTTSFNRPGVYSVSVEVSEGKFKDNAECQILILDESYYESNCAIDILKDTGNRFSIGSGLTFFRIPHTMMPLDWHPDLLNLNYVSLNAPNDEDALVFNGERVMIGQCYRHFYFRGLPTGLDICFAVSSVMPRTIELAIAWLDNASARIPDTDVDFPHYVVPGSIELGRHQVPATYPLDGVTQFSIGPRLLPPFWKPSAFIIQILHADDDARLLEGTFSTGEREEPLTSWCSTFKVTDFILEPSLTFTLSTPDNRSVRIVWWPE